MLMLEIKGTMSLESVAAAFPFESPAKNADYAHL